MLDDLIDLGTPGEGDDSTPPAAGNPESVGAKEKASMTNNSSWLEGLDDSLKVEPTLSRFEDVGTLAKSYVELRKQMGKPVFPNEKTTEEELQDFYRKAGIPDAEKYNVDIKKFGLNEELANELKTIASQSGVPENGLSKVFEFLQSASSKQNENIAAERKAQLMEQAEGLKQEYGEAFNKYAKLAGEVAKEIYSPEEISSLKEEGFFSNPMVAKLLMSQAKSKFGEELISDDHTKQNFVVTPNQAKDRVTELMSDPAYSNSSDPRHKSLVQQVEKLHQVLANS